MNPKEIETLIVQGLPEARVQVVTDGAGHYEALVVSPAFRGKRSIQRHQMVYGTLGQRVGNEIHALALKTFAPEELPSAQS